MSRVIFWDFDGTLGYRGRYGQRLGFATCLVEVLDAHSPGHGIERRAFHPYLHTGFPWHAPDSTHLHLCDPDDWWDALFPVFETAFAGVGVDAEAARTLARHMRARYADPSQWALYDDVLPVLRHLADRGWRHVIVSNHVPELPAIASGCGLDDLVEAVHTSGITGYEKPHPEMFDIAMRAAGAPRTAWFVGDNIVADYEGPSGPGSRRSSSATRSPAIAARPPASGRRRS